MNYANKIEKFVRKVTDKNLKLNRKYWKTVGLHEGTCDKETILNVFDSQSEYLTYRKYMCQKINTFSKEFNVSEDKIIKDIRKNKTLCNVLAISAKRQGVHEKAQKLILFDIIKNFKKKYSKKLEFSFIENEVEQHFLIDSEGKINVDTYGSEKNSLASKQFDGILEIKKGDIIYRIFLILKHTTDRGGAQDNVKGEVLYTYNFSLKNNEKNNYFLFLLDGRYWDSYRNSILQTDNIIVSNCDECEKYLNKLIKENILGFKWLKRSNLVGIIQ